MATSTTTTAADLRAEIARRRVKVYELAAAVPINPGSLSAILNERRPLPHGFAERVLRALDRVPTQ